MVSPYEKCPVFENEKYLLRYVDAADAPDLLLVYSDEKAWPIFNSDNCTGDFHCTLPEHVKDMIKFWQLEYDRKHFVRWSIIDKNISRAIGTIELFNRRADDYFNNCGLLRLDVRSDYECRKDILGILPLILPSVCELFDCEMIATKVPHIASERKQAVEELHFKASDEKLIGGHDRKIYTEYYVLQD